MKLITVFTPTYNRKKTLVKCYESLVAQTSNNFIWQIIDDGSSDNTEELVKGFVEEGKIEISYVKKQNGGKVSAINYSLDITDTELWVCLDSDDYFFPNALEQIEHYYRHTNENSICGFIAVRSRKDGSPMQGKKYEGRIKTLPKTVKYMDYRYQYHIPPEYVLVYKSEIIKKYSYPTFEGEKFMPESSVYCLLDKEYSMITMKEPLMVSEFQEDGLTMNHRKNVLNNPKGYTYTHAVIADCTNSLSCFVKSSVCYQIGRSLGGDKYSFHNWKWVVGAFKPLGIIARYVLYGR